MSQENFVTFMLKAIENESVLDQIRLFKKNDVEGFLNYAKTLGFEFTAEDMLTVSENININASEVELTDAQLDQISGGHQFFSTQNAVQLTIELTALLIK